MAIEFDADETTLARLTGTRIIGKAEQAEDS